MSADLKPRGAVLIGGRSRRMGRDKASLPGPDGTPLAVRVAETLRTAGATEVFAIGGARAPAWEAPAWLPDLRGGAGPLAGLEAALALGGWWWLVACDLPGVRAEDLGVLLAAREGERPVVAWLDGRCQPLLGLYGPAQLGPLRTALDAGRLRAVEVVGEWRPVRVDLGSVSNLNTPDEFARWARDASDPEAPRIS